MKYKVSIFIVLIIAQLYVPSQMIASREDVLKNGSVYKFKTAPVDPYDVMRGRYVALGFGNTNVKMVDDSKFERKQTIYVDIEVGIDGFVKFTQAHLRRPVSGDYLRTKVQYVSGDKVHFFIPFRRYYMNEKKAYETELLYLNVQRTEGTEAFVLVRVKKGMAVIEDLVIDQKPVAEYFK